jgi:hypothetical protein
MTEFLTRKIATSFASSIDQAEANEILSRVANASERVCLAILKLAGGRLDRLRHFVDVANADFRDVIAWAENPREFDLPTSSDDATRAKARAEDKSSYQTWLDA